MLSDSMDSLSPDPLWVPRLWICFTNIHAILAIYINVKLWKENLSILSSIPFNIIYDMIRLQ